QAPAPGAMGYMMSKQGHLSDVDGHWHPHLMLFEPHTPLSSFGGNPAGLPVVRVAGRFGGRHGPVCSREQMVRRNIGVHGDALALRPFEPEPPDQGKVLRAWQASRPSLLRGCAVSLRRAVLSVRR